jgi:uncharacterized membrane protein
MDSVDTRLVVGGLACATLSCLFVVSTVLLVLILIRRARRNRTPEA